MSKSKMLKLSEVLLKLSPKLATNDVCMFFIGEAEIPESLKTELENEQ